MGIAYEITNDGRLQPTIVPELSAKDNIPFITAYLNEWENSEQRKYMDVCERYYNNENDILKVERTVIGKDVNNNPVMKKSLVLSNNKLCHSFLKKLAKQKLGYSISKPFTIDLANADDDLGKQMINDVSDYYDTHFHKMVKNCARDSIIDGLGWVQVYYDETGSLNFKRIPAREVTPIWKDIDHEELSGVIRKFIVDDYSTGQKHSTTHVEYYTTNTVYYYVYIDSDLVVDESRIVGGQSTQYFEKSLDSAVIGKTWGKVPFVPFKYNAEETTLLSKIKSLIDDYDKKTSNIANLIDDIPNSITVIKNYDGSSKEEFVENKNSYRTIFVQGDGDARALETPLNIDQIDLHLQRLREDIYEFGQGVNTADKDIRDTSGVALRFLYADLDMDCNDWSPELEMSIKQLIEFILADIKNKKGIDYSKVKYSIIFNTDVIINETETITNCFTSKGVISDKTIAANHPWTRNVDKEMKDMLSDDKQELELEAEYGKATDKTIDNQIRTSGVE